MGNLVDPFPVVYRRVLRQTDKRNVQAASLVLVNSAYSRESLYRTYGLFAQINYLGVDAEQFRACDLEDADFVVTVGALTPRKGFDLIIRSLALLQTRERPRLVVVSNYAEPQEKEYLSALANHLAVNVTFRSNVRDEELVDLYNRARLTVYAPIMEPFGFVPLESMACGTAVVAVNEAGIRETVKHGSTGLLTEREPEHFSHAIRALLRDHTRRRLYGKQARAYVAAEWSWERSVSGIEQHLSRLAGGESH
jgi:glycosyltransferase involved in cell wall biosynthesis